MNVRVEWYDHDCEWVSKYCDDHHTRSASLPIELLQDPAAFLNSVNPWPRLDERYFAAKEAELGDQLRPVERTDRVMVELGNAFAAGALWQYGRGQERQSRETE